MRHRDLHPPIADSHDAEYRHHPLAPVIEWFEAQGYAYRLDERGDIDAVFHDGSERYRVEVKARVGQIIHEISLPIRLQPQHQGDVLETLARANASDAACTLVARIDEGVLLCRAAAHCDSAPPDATFVGGLFDDALLKAMTYTGFLREVMTGTLTPAQAAEHAERCLAELRGQHVDDIDDAA